MAEKFNQAEYIKEYQRENRITKKVTFNRKNPDDMEMVEWLNNRPEGIVQYLKRLIREDMKHSKTREPSPEFDDPICALCTDENRADCKKHDNTIKIELVDDFEDKEAIEKATKEGHRLYHDVIGYHDVMIDVDERKVLKVKNRCPLSFE